MSAALDDDAPWPLHERLLGASLRVALAVIPATLGVLAVIRPDSLAAARAIAVGVALLAAALVLPERRDRWSGVAALLAAAGAAVAAIFHVAVDAWLENLGDPVAPYKALGAFASSRFAPMIVGAWALAGALLSLPLVLRTRAAAGLAALALAGVALAAGTPEWAAALALAAVLGHEGVRLGDRLAGRLDPLAPAAVSRRAAPALAAWATLVVPLLCVVMPSLSPRERTHSAPEEQALRDLRAIGGAQHLFIDQDLGGDGAFAGTLAELGATDYLPDGLAEGVRGGYLFRLVRSTQPRHRWAAAADPVVRGVTGDLSFFLDNRGRLLVSTRPIPFGEDCRPGAGEAPVIEP